MSTAISSAFAQAATCAWCVKTITCVGEARRRGDASRRSTTIRLDPDVLDAFKAAGPGWQTLINETLRRAVARRKAKAS